MDLYKFGWTNTTDSLLLSRTGYDSMIIAITDPGSFRLRCVKAFDANRSRLYKVNAKSSRDSGQLYLQVSRQPWRENTKGSLYRISDDAHPVFLPVMQFNMYTAIAYHDNEKDMLRLQPVWTGDETEGVLSENRYAITLYFFDGNMYRRKFLGVTKNKYAGKFSRVCAAELLYAMFLQKEKILAGIPLEYFILNSYESFDVPPEIKNLPFKEVI